MEGGDFGSGAVKWDGQKETAGPSAALPRHAGIGGMTSLYKILISSPVELSWGGNSSGQQNHEGHTSTGSSRCIAKTIADRSIVQAIFTTKGSLRAALIGAVYPAPGGAALVKPRRESAQPVLRFDPSAATSFRVSDGRSFRRGVFGNYRGVASAISFCYPDNTNVTLLELTHMALVNEDDPKGGAAFMNGSLP